MVVGVERRRDRTDQGTLSREIRLEERLRAISLVARPAEVRSRGSVVDLLPGVPADIAQVHLIGPGLDRVPERVAHPIGPDPRSPGVRPVIERVVRWRGSVGIDAQDLPVRAVQVLGAQRVRITVGAIADSDEQGAVVREVKGPERVRAAIRADAVGARGLGAARWRPDAAEDHLLASRQGHIGIRRVGCNPHQARGPRGAAVRIARILERVGHVDAAVAGELRIERQTPEPAVVERVDLGAQVDERCGQQLPVLDHSHDAVLLPNEHAPVRSERHADQGERREGGDPLGCEPRIVEGVRGRPILRGEEAEGDADGSNQAREFPETAHPQCLTGITQQGGRQSRKDPPKTAPLQAPSFGSEPRPGLVPARKLGEAVPRSRRFGLPLWVRVRQSRRSPKGVFEESPDTRGHGGG